MGLQVVGKACVLMGPHVVGKACALMGPHVVGKVYMHQWGHMWLVKLVCTNGVMVGW